MFNYDSSKIPEVSFHMVMPTLDNQELNIYKVDGDEQNGDSYIELEAHETLSNAENQIYTWIAWYNFLVSRGISE
jgi:hypothetical protein